jgi:hypothetical protein
VKHKYSDYKIYKAINKFKAGYWEAVIEANEILVAIPKAGSIYSTDTYLAAKPREGLQQWLTWHGNYTKLSEPCVLPATKHQINNNLYAIIIDNMTLDEIIDLGLFINNPKIKNKQSTTKQYI